MMENSASPLAEATAPITAEEADTSPATGAATSVSPPSGKVSRASSWPAVTVSPGSARISATFSPGRSGRTAVSSRGMTIPDTSTMAEKQDFAAFSTVTAAPLGASFGVSGSSAARQGSAARANNAASAGAKSFRESARAGSGFIGIPVTVSERHRYQKAVARAKRRW